MFTPARVVLTCLLATIAWGCSNTTASSGGGTTSGTDVQSDSSVSDASGTDASGTDTSGTDATSGDDSVGDQVDASATDVSSGTDATIDAGPDVVLTSCPNVLKDKALGLHGKACSDDAECEYGRCEKGGFLLGYDAAKGYCTKDCNCPDASGQCDSDNASGKEFVCAHEMSKTGGNDKAGAVPEWRCAVHCKNDAECAAWNPGTPHCIGSTKYVSSSGVCGFDPFK